jgi:hypothetical protein
MQNIQVIQRSSNHFRADARQRAALFLATGQAGDLMPGAEQLPNHGRPNPPSGTRNEYVHEQRSCLKKARSKVFYNLNTAQDLY